MQFTIAQPACRICSIGHRPVLLGPTTGVVDDDVRAGFAEDPRDVVRIARSLLDDLGRVLAEPVVGRRERP